MKQFRRCSTQPGLTTGGRELGNFRLGWGVIFDCGSLAAKMCNQQRHTCPNCGVVGWWGWRGQSRANKTCVNLNIFDFKINLIYMLFLSGALNWYWLNVRVEIFGRECVIAAVTVRCNIICSGGLSKPHPLFEWVVGERTDFPQSGNLARKGGQSRGKGVSEQDVCDWMCTLKILIHCLAILLRWL